MKFKRDQDNLTPAEAIVVDEALRMDLLLANLLFKAVAPDAHLLIMGDTDQSLSVGPRARLNDLTASGLMPIVRLTQVFRQTQQHAIVIDAHQINQGELPQLKRVCNKPKSDCLWFLAENPEYGVAETRDIVTHFIQQLGFNPTRDVQVLRLIRRGEMGTCNLNQVL